MRRAGGGRGSVRGLAVAAVLVSTVVSTSCGDTASASSAGRGGSGGATAPATTGGTTAASTGGTGPAVANSGGTGTPSGASGTPSGGSGTDGAMAGNGGMDAGTAVVDAGALSAWWRPSAGVTWDWQLSSTDLSHDVDVYDIDYEEDADTVTALHAKGIHVICYVSVGSWESYRPDASDFPDEVVGNEYPGWPDEKFIDIRASALRDLMAARFDECQRKGFDGLEPDNMDVFESNSGFPLSRADGRDYARWLAAEAHARGLAVFQKNASSLASSLFDLYDGAITEDCYDQRWCDDMLGYTDRDKPVLMAEYTDTDVDFEAACTWAETNDFSPILKDRDLTAELETCP